MLAGDIAEHPALVGVDGNGFLDEHVLARRQGEAGVLVVVAVGRGDVDDVDMWIDYELGVGAVGFGG